MANLKFNFDTWFYLGPDDDNDRYDDEPETSNNPDFSDIYGSINEHIEFQIMENPYYDDDEEMDNIHTTAGNNKTGLNNSEVVTAQDNIYYELWVTLFQLHRH